tara:strand:- start:6969 stop:7772 length:804 start_codon:yes stop_codon:yes gene_type:complete
MDSTTESRGLSLWENIKNHIRDRTKDNLESFEYENFNNEYYIRSAPAKLKFIEKLIDRYVTLLNSGWPFVAYNFDGEIFKEENFFDDCYTTHITDIPLLISQYDLLDDKNGISIVLQLDIEPTKSLINFIGRDHYRAMALSSLIKKKTFLLTDIKSNNIKHGVIKSQEVWNLYAQGFISPDPFIENPESIFKYKNQVFKDQSEQIRHIEQHVLGFTGIQTYLNSVTSNIPRALQNSDTLIRKTMKACIAKGLVVSSQFKSKHDSLED